jgi:hypothetical protein
LSGGNYNGSSNKHVGPDVPWVDPLILQIRTPEALLFRRDGNGLPELLAILVPSSGGRREIIYRFDGILHKKAALMFFVILARGV